MAVVPCCCCCPHCGYCACTSVAERGGGTLLLLLHPRLDLLCFLLSGLPADGTIAAEVGGAGGARCLVLAVWSGTLSHLSSDLRW